MSASANRNAYLPAVADTKLAASGLPFIRGTWFFVDADTGASTNDGLTVDTAFASIETAYAACTSGAGDGIAVIAKGTTTAETTSYLTAAITWSKWGITVFGVCAPTRFSQRARISTQEEDLANLITVSGHNNSFYNLSLYNGGTTGAGCISVTGQRNYFENVHMMGGMGMTTPTVNDYSLLLKAGHENTFVNCVFGNDTFDKTDIAGAEIHFDDGAMRNRFYGCEVIDYRSAGTTAGSIKLIGAGDSITRTVLFDNCFFQMYRDGDVTAEVSVVIGTAPNNGMLVFKNCLRLGFTDWGAAASARVFSGSPTLAEAGGIAIVANPS
jgi:hypothetical protein